MQRERPIRERTQAKLCHDSGEEPGAEIWQKQLQGVKEFSVSTLGKEVCEGTMPQTKTCSPKREESHLHCFFKKSKHEPLIFADLLFLPLTLAR